jgi:carbon-monoxide dehydrogenase medium subunit
MYPPKFDYYRAASVDEALSLLQQHDGSKLLAGGHSLLPILKLRLVAPSALIDIGRIAELKGITVQDGSVRIGALTPHVAIEKSALVPRALAQAAGVVGDPMVRNRGTVAGSVAHADPAADLPTVLLALGATFHIAGAGNGQTRTRVVHASDFFTGLFTTALGKDEILTAVEVPAERAGTGSAYAKLSNPASRYAMVGAAAALTMNGGTCTVASIAIGGLTPWTVKTPSVAAALVGRTLSADVIAAAAAAVADDLGDDILSDVHGSVAYRRQMAPVFVGQALTQAAERAADVGQP